MRALVQTAVGEFGEQDVARPRPAPGEAVARVLAAVTCGTDVKLLTRGHAAIELPVTMGHELCGEIVEVGEGVDPGLVGARVVPGVTGPCGACPECARGLPNLCGAAHADRTWGAFAEFVRIPARVVAGNLHRVPEGLSDEAAAFVDPLAAVLHGWRKLGPIGASERIVVVGAGALAWLWAATARKRGVGCTIAARSNSRATLAEGFGAQLHDLSASGWPSSFDAAVDATGDPDVWSRLPEAVRPGGRVLLFGGCAPGTAVSFDAARLHYSEISLVGSFHSTPAEATEAMALLAARDVDPLPLVSGRGGLEDASRFFVGLWAGEGIRYAIRPETNAS